MHADEVDAPSRLVAGLLAGQFPHWAELPLEPVPSYGTDNHLYRLGDELLVRLPKIEGATGQIEMERRWLPWLAPQLPVQVPQIVAVGEPALGYPWRWAVYAWLEGETPRRGTPELAQDVAGFIAAVQRLETAGAPSGRHRGGPLSLRDRDTRVALAQLEDELDVGAATAAWERALAVPPWPHAPVWLHGDLLEGNLLVRDGRLRAVIDWGAASAGDPAFDYHLAWSLLAPVREEFRAACDIDDDTWARARGLALSQALIALPYYLHTSPPIVARSRLIVREVLGDRS